MSLIRKHVAVLQAWACLALVLPLRGLKSMSFLGLRRSWSFTSCSIIVTVLRHRWDFACVRQPGKAYFQSSTPRCIVTLISGIN